MRETELYLPVKQYFCSLGYEVKSEICGCDIVARGCDQSWTIIELKTVFSLQLIYQGLERLAITDLVYLAVPKPKFPRGSGLQKYRNMLKLCKRLGLGLLFVQSNGDVKAVVEPKPYTSRKNERKSQSIFKEFESRAGDPNIGGQTKKTIITAYRQDAIRCGKFLEQTGPSKLGDIRKFTQVRRAGTILQKNHYGWFERKQRGIYALSQAGNLAMVEEYKNIL